MIMCSADDTSGENIGGSDASGEGPGRDNLTPYLALVISTYGATKSFLATTVAAVTAASESLRPGRDRQETWSRLLTPGRRPRPR
jgi:hypothetical protein